MPDTPSPTIRDVSGRSRCSNCGQRVITMTAAVAATREEGGGRIAETVHVTAEPCGHTFTIPRLEHPMLA